MDSGAAVRIFPLEYQNSQEICCDGDLFLQCSCFPVNFAKFFGTFADSIILVRWLIVGGYFYEFLQTATL